MIKFRTSSLEESSRSWTSYQVCGGGQGSFLCLASPCYGPLACRGPWSGFASTWRWCTELWGWLNEKPFFSSPIWAVVYIAQVIVCMIRINDCLYYISFRYFISTWIEGNYRPEEWNFFDEDDLTTSNAAESTNWRFTVKTGSAHPNVYTSIKKDIKETEHQIDRW